MMEIAFYVPEKAFYDKVVPLLREKKYLWGNSAPTIRNGESFYLATTQFGFTCVYKDIESLFKAKYRMRFFPFESLNINFI